MLWNGTNGNEKIDNLIQEMQSRKYLNGFHTINSIMLKKQEKMNLSQYIQQNGKWVHYVMIYIQKYMKDIQIRSYIKMF